MTQAVNKFIPIFVGLLLILHGLLWISDGKNGLWLSGRENIHERADGMFPEV